MSLKLVLIWATAVATTALLSSAMGAGMEVQLDRSEQLAGFSIINATGFRVRKHNRTTWVMSGEGDVFLDLSDEYSFVTSTAYSRLGNNQFNEYPLKLAKDKECNVLNTEYKEYQEYFVRSTNFPHIGEERLCPFPKGHYWVNDLAPDGGWVPSVVPEGYWRLTLDMLDADSNVLVRLVYHMHIRRKLY